MVVREIVEEVVLSWKWEAAALAAPERSTRDLTLFSEAKKPLFFYFFGFFGVAGRKERQSGNPHDICDIPYFENLRIFFENRKCMPAPFFS